MAFNELPVQSVRIHRYLPAGSVRDDYYGSFQERMSRRRRQAINDGAQPLTAHHMAMALPVNKFQIDAVVACF
jgi:hypothetical protein